MIAEIAKFGRRAVAAARGESGKKWPVVRLCHCEARGREGDCARSAVGVLDRQIAETYERVLKSAAPARPATSAAPSRDFLATRNTSFGRPGL